MRSTWDLRDGWPILTSRFSTLGWEAKMPAEQSHPYTVIPSAVACSRSESATQSRDPAFVCSTINAARHSD
jgi:hypothetical protein